MKQTLEAIEETPLTNGFGVGENRCEQVLRQLLFRNKGIFLDMYMRQAVDTGSGICV